MLSGCHTGTIHGEGQIKHFKKQSQITITFFDKKKISTRVSLLFSSLPSEALESASGRLKGHRHKQVVHVSKHNYYCFFA